MHNQLGNIYRCAEHTFRSPEPRRNRGHLYGLDREIADCPHADAGRSQRPVPPSFSPTAEQRALGNWAGFRSTLRPYAQSLKPSSPLPLAASVLYLVSNRPVLHAAGAVTRIAVRARYDF